MEGLWSGMWERTRACKVGHVCAGCCQPRGGFASGSCPRAQGRRAVSNSSARAALVRLWPSITFQLTKEAVVAKLVARQHGAGAARRDGGASGVALGADTQGLTDRAGRVSSQSQAQARRLGWLQGPVSPVSSCSRGAMVMASCGERAHLIARISQGTCHRLPLTRARLRRTTAPVDQRAMSCCGTVLLASCRRT